MCNSIFSNKNQKYIISIKLNATECEEVCIHFGEYAVSHPKNGSLNFSCQDAEQLGCSSIDWRPSEKKMGHLQCIQMK